MPATEQKAAEIRAENRPLSQSEMETLRRAFAEDGYFVIRGVVSREKLSHLRDRMFEEFDSAKKSGALFSGGGMLSGHLNCFPGEEARFVYETLQERGIIDLIRSLGLKAERMPNVGCNFNLPGSAVQHYHPDHDFTKEFLILNVAVVDTTLENGAMEMAPGTHKKFYKYWRFAIERPHRNSLRLPMGQGDVIVRTSNAWHRGMPNRTEVPRPMLAFTWEGGGSERDDPFMAYDGRIKFIPNWYKPTPLGRLRERTFVTFPFTYSLYRFVSSLFGSKGY
jgi:ectoine hydroxylase-related dioxygenase (phytanoyl-CoA dioxygenase family)